MISLLSSFSFFNAKPYPSNKIELFSSYGKQAVVFFALSVTNNVALDYKISMPLHMIFRSSSLVSTLFIGQFIYRQKYARLLFQSILPSIIASIIPNRCVSRLLMCLCSSYGFGKWFGCMLVSVGIFISTIADAIAHGKLHIECCSFSSFSGGLLSDEAKMWDSAVALFRDPETIFGHLQKTVRVLIINASVFYSSHDLCEIPD